MTAKIEQWIMEAASVVMDACDADADDNNPFTTIKIANIIAAHAPKETGIKPDTVQAIRQEPSVPVSELQHIVDNVSALKDLRIKLQQLIRRYQPVTGEDSSIKDARADYYDDLAHGGAEHE